MMKSFAEYLTEQIQIHPVMQPQDVTKLCYQAAFGAEHLLSDTAAAKRYFNAEFEAVSERDVPLYEEISPEVCRVNLAAWKASGLPSEWLFSMFVHSASVPHGSQRLFAEYLETAECIVKRGKMVFSEDEWQEYQRKYQEMGQPSVHHSQRYRDSEYPAYRIVNRQFLTVLPILFEASKYAEKKQITVIAIDGRAAAGKSTTAQILKWILNADVIEVDDFFLPPVLRTEERLAKPGGNVHYERFTEEVLPNLRKEDGFSYRRFDCSRMDYDGRRTVGTSLWRIVEGSYSLHPIFGEYADLKVFLNVKAEEQKRRIVLRNGNEMAAMFETRWIPMEECYFEAYHVKENADIVLKTDDEKFV